MNLSWEDAQTFLAVSEHQSFSAAAKSLSVGQPTISRRMRKLETELNSQLFIRGRQGAHPTAAALKLIPAAEQMARWAGEFDRAAMGVEQSISGTVRIAAPPGIAVDLMAPFAMRLRKLEPQIRLEILSSVDHLDLSRGEADLAIRTRAPTEPELYALHEKFSNIGVFSTRAYAAKLNQPCTWIDLDWISWASPYLDVAPRPMLEKLIPDFNPVFASDDYLVQKAAVKAGLGAMIMERPPKLTALADTLPTSSAQDNDLVEIDMGFNIPVSSFFIVCAKSMQYVPRVSRVATLLISHLASPEITPTGSTSK